MCKLSKLKERETETERDRGTETDRETEQRTVECDNILSHPFTFYRFLSFESNTGD